MTQGQVDIFDSFVAFQALFQAAGFQHPTEAAAYYVVYCGAFNEITGLSTLLDKAIPLSPAISRKTIVNGRGELLWRGIMAKRVLSHGPGSQDEFGREAFFPASPALIWEDLEGEMKTKAGGELVDTMRRSAEHLSEQHRAFFGRNGLALECGGKVTLQYSGLWVNYLILSLCTEAPRSVSLWLTGLRTYAEPIQERFIRILETGSTVRIIFDRMSNTQAAQRIQESHDHLHIRFTRVRTVRRLAIIDDVLALDGLRILPADSPPPGYVGTAYLDRDSISTLREVFEDKWALETEE